MAEEKEIQPRDLLVHLESGDRTMEFLEKDVSPNQPLPTLGSGWIPVSSLGAGGLGGAIGSFAIMDNAVQLYGSLIGSQQSAFGLQNQIGRSIW